MATNTTVFMIVATVAALMLVGMLVVVVRKTRNQLRRQKALEIEFAARPRTDTAQHQGRAYRSEAVTSRDQLNEQRVYRVAG